MLSSWRARLLATAVLVAVWPACPAWSAPGDPVAPPPSSPSGTLSTDESGAMVKAKREHRRVEVDSLTTERRKVVANPDSGKFEAQINANPVRVKQSSGWLELDATLQRSGGRIKPKVAKVDLDVTAGGGGPLVTVADAGKSFGLTWTADKALPTPVVKDDKAIYSDVRPGIDLVVQTNAYGFSQYLVVRTRAAAADPLLRSFAFDVSAPDLTVSKVDGGLEARDSTGEVVFAAPRLQMWSSTGTVPTSSSVDASAYVTGSMEHGKTADVAFTLATGRLTLTPDRSVLDDPDVTYPVVIDPSVSKRQSNWTMVWSNGDHFWNPDDDDQSARAGYDGWSGQNKKSRVFYTFDTKALNGKTVTSATFTHKQIHSPSNDCSKKTDDPPVNLHRSGTISSSTRWPGPTAYDKLDDSNLTVGAITVCKKTSLEEWKATDGAKDAAKNGWDSLTLRLASDDEGDKWGWRQYQNTSSYPVLSVTYNTAPIVPDAVAIAGMKSYGGANYLGTTTPQLTVTVKDADTGDAVKGVFIVNPIDPADSLDDRTFIESKPVTSPGTTGKPVSVTVPSGVMSDGQSYSIYARADDGYIQTVSGPTTHLVVDTTVPGAPALTGGPTGTVAQGSTVTFHVDAPEDDVASYLYGVNSGAPSTTITPSSLGAGVDISVVANQFGPNFFTVQSVDRAGNRTATPVRFEFKVDGTLPSNRYRLDKNGADTRWATAPGSSASDVVIPVTPAATWVPGRDAKLDDGTSPRDCTDSALQLSPSTPVKGVATATGHPLDTSESFTASAWLETDDTSPTSSSLGERYAVTMPIGPSSVAFSLGYRKDPSGAVYWLYTLGDTTTRMRVEDSNLTPAAVTPGKWTHVTGVYDAAANTASLYVDGNLIVTKAATVRPVRGTQLSLGAGGYTGSQQLTWNGAVDEVLLYQGALNATQVREQYAVRRPAAGC